MAGLLDKFKDIFTAPAVQGPVQPGGAALSQGGLLTQFQDKMKDPEFKKGVLSFGADMLQNKDPSFSAALGHGLNAYQASREASEANNTAKASKQSQIDKVAADMAKEENAAKSQAAYIESTNRAIAAAPPEIKDALTVYSTPEGGVGSKEAADTANKVLDEYRQQQALDIRQKTALNTVPASTQATIGAANQRQAEELAFRQAHPSGQGGRAIVYNPALGYEASARFVNPGEDLREGEVPHVPGVMQSGTSKAAITAREKELSNKPTLMGKVVKEQKEAGAAVAAPEKIYRAQHLITRIDEAIGSPNYTPEENDRIRAVLTSNIGHLATVQHVKAFFPKSDAKDLAVKIKGIVSDAFVTGKEALGSEQLNASEDARVESIVLSFDEAQTPEQVIKAFSDFRKFNQERIDYNKDLMRKHGVTAPGITTGGISASQADAIIKAAMGN